MNCCALENMNKCNQDAEKLSVPNDTGVAVVPAMLGGGVPGGVVSMPLSSIIFLLAMKFCKRGSKKRDISWESKENTLN